MSPTLPPRPSPAPRPTPAPAVFRAPGFNSPAPDFHRGYLRVPLNFWRAVYCRSPLTRRQLQLVSVILRESWGWTRRGGEVQLWTRRLSVRSFADLTGLSTDRLGRDLRALVARGVLRERDGRYQLVPQPELWITPPAAKSAPPKARARPPKAPAFPAETAPPAPHTKTAKKRKRNVPVLSRPGLSPAVDNSPAPAVAILLEVIATFAGPLTSREQRALHARIRWQGAAAVWTALEPGLREGPQNGRRWLAAYLAAPSEPATSEEAGG